MPRVINLDQFRAKIEAEKCYTIEAGGRQFKLLPAELLPDEAIAVMHGDDPVAQARVMLDDYDGFVAAGGSALLLAQIIAEVAKEEAAEQGADPGEG